MAQVSSLLILVMHAFPVEIRYPDPANVAVSHFKGSSTQLSLASDMDVPLRNASHQIQQPQAQIGKTDNIRTTLWIVQSYDLHTTGGLSACPINDKKKGGTYLCIPVDEKLEVCHCAGRPFRRVPLISSTGQRPDVTKQPRCA